MPQCGNPWEKPDIVNCRRCKQRELKRARTRRKKAERADELERKRKNKEWAATHCYICGSLMDNPDPKCYRCRERMKRREKWLERRNERMKPNDLNNLEGVRKFLQARRRRLNQDPHTPITGRPLTIVAAALATVPTGFFLAALITGGCVNIISSIITLGMYWLGVGIVAIFETNQRPARTNREEH